MQNCLPFLLLSHSLTFEMLKSFIFMFSMEKKKKKQKIWHEFKRKICINTILTISYSKLTFYFTFSAMTFEYFSLQFHALSSFLQRHSSSFFIIRMIFKGWIVFFKISPSPCASHGIKSVKIITPKKTKETNKERKKKFVFIQSSFFPFPIRILTSLHTLSPLYLHEQRAVIKLKWLNGDKWALLIETEIMR